MNNNSNSTVALTLVCLTALSCVGKAQEIPQIGRLGADIQGSDMQGSGAPKAKPIFPKKVIQIGKRIHNFKKDADTGEKVFSPWNGNLTLEDVNGQWRNAWGFEMLTSLRVMDDQTPSKPYTKGRIGEQLSDPITYGVKDAHGNQLNLTAHKLRSLEQPVTPAGHGGDFVDTNGYAFDTSTFGNPNNPNEKWFSLIQGFVIIDTKSRGNIPDPAVRAEFSQQQVGFKSYRGLRISQSHALTYYRAYYKRFIGGVSTP